MGPKSISSESLPFVLETRQIIVVGIISLTEVDSDVKHYSRYICSPHLFTAAKNHVYSPSSTGLILHRINLDSIIKHFSPASWTSLAMSALKLPPAGVNAQYLSASRI